MRRAAPASPTDRIPIRCSQALQGASSTSVTNSDGSVTTSLTYADGSKVTMTSAAGRSSSSISDIVLQFHRADDPAPGPGDFVGRHRIALGQRLTTRPGEILRTAT